jgi:hypothetical protein
MTNELWIGLAVILGVTGLAGLAVFLVNRAAKRERERINKRIAEANRLETQKAWAQQAQAKQAVALGGIHKSAGWDNAVLSSRGLPPKPAEEVARKQEDDSGLLQMAVGALIVESVMEASAPAISYDPPAAVDDTSSPDICDGGTSGGGGASGDW